MAGLMIDDGSPPRGIRGAALAADRRAYVAQIMGLPFSLHCRGPFDAAAEAQAVDAVWEYLRWADAVFSPYRSDSDISRIGRGELTVHGAHPEVAEVLALAEEAKALTGGAFDVYYAGRLDPSGIVKGWAAARAAAAIDSLGVDWYLGAGGDIAVCTRGFGPPWRIGIEDPDDATRTLAVLPLADGAIATSGRSHRGDHIVDPAAGAAARGIAQATVYGPDLVWADIFATALVAAGTLQPDWPLPSGYECLLVTDGGDTAASGGMAELIAGGAASEVPAPRAALPRVIAAPRAAPATGRQP